MGTTKQYYRVHVTPKYPAWDEKNGWDYAVYADSKAEAIKRARSQASNDGRVDRQFPASFKAEPMEKAVDWLDWDW